MLTVFSAMAELARESILERQREGIALVKDKGRKKIEVDTDAFTAVVADWRADKITAVEAMKRLNRSKNTFYRRVEEQGSEDPASFFGGKSL